MQKNGLKNILLNKKKTLKQKFVGSAKNALEYVEGKKPEPQKVSTWCA